MALAGMAGCGRAPEQHIVPYVKQPDGLILGRPQQYATVMPFGEDAIGILVESHEGRPTKIEGIRIILRASARRMRLRRRPFSICTIPIGQKRQPTRAISALGQHSRRRLQI